MYKITKDGTTLAMMEAPNYVKQAENGCFVLCAAEEAAGIACAGTVYHLLGRPDLDGVETTVMLEQADAGAEIYAAKETAEGTAAVTSQVAVAAKVYAKAATEIPDVAALAMPDLFQTWEEALADGAALAAGVVINDGGTLYRVVSAGGVTPLESQPPHSEGMLAVYRPIDQIHAGTMEDPIPWVYGMDCTAGKYYSHEGGLWLCNGDMIPCTWAPGTAGVWQWEAVVE